MFKEIIRYLGISFVFDGNKVKTKNKNIYPIPIS
jgi:hypothetical protein